MTNKIGNHRARVTKYGMHEREFSPELKAKMKENSRINNKGIKYIKFTHTTQDQRLMAEIL